MGGLESSGSRVVWIVSLISAACVATAEPGAQEVIELPGEDRRLDLHFEEVYRVGSVLGEEWHGGREAARASRKLSRK